MAEDKQPLKVRFTYEKAEGYGLVHTTGVRGGLTPGGGIMFELFSEAGVPPEEEVHELNPNGSLGKLLYPAPDKEMIRVLRRLQVGVAVSLEDAGKIADWLKEKVVEGQARRAVIASMKQEDQEDA